jgi:hypothetical protein
VEDRTAQHRNRTALPVTLTPARVLRGECPRTLARCCYVPKAAEHASQDVQDVSNDRALRSLRK